MKTELTKTEKMLCKYLSMTEITSKEAADLCLWLPEELDQLDFLAWLMDHLDASMSDMLKEVVKIRTSDPGNGQ